MLIAYMYGQASRLHACGLHTRVCHVHDMQVLMQTQMEGLIFFLKPGEKDFNGDTIMRDQYGFAIYHFDPYNTLQRVDDPTGLLGEDFVMLDATELAQLDIVMHS